MKAFAVGGLIACLASFPAWAVCVAPASSPTVPNGATASRDDMLAAQNALKAYDAAIQDYVTCLSHTGSVDEFNRNQPLQDAALHKLRIVADQFNQELRAFKEKNSA